MKQLDLFDLPAEVVAGNTGKQARPALLPEEWREVSWAADYEVSSYGRVASWKPYRKNASPPKTRRLLRMAVDKDGYRKVVLLTGKTRTTVRVCRLVAAAWHGNPQAGDVVRHLDGSRTNDYPVNLTWGTPRENSNDKITHGTMVFGSNVNTSRLTEKDVRQVLASDRSHSSLAKELGVTPCAIWHIRAGRTWKHVERT